jgi:hypothetical protein
VYGTPVDVGKVLTYKVTGLSAGTYYFAVTAYISVIQSGYSNELKVDVPGNPTNFRLIAVLIDAQGNVTFRLVEVPPNFFRIS